MSERPLKQAIRDMVNRGGPQGHLLKSDLSRRSGVSVHLIEKVLTKQGHTPKEENVKALWRGIRAIEAELDEKERQPKPAA